MKVNDEKELKLLINRQGYDEIIILFPTTGRTLNQTNYYFDNQMQSLRNNGITLRIRVEDSSYEICMKVKNKNRKSRITSSKEYNISINNDIFKNILKHPGGLLNFFSEEAISIYNQVNLENTPLSLIGSIENTRKYLKGSFGYIFELDAVTFPNNSKIYELEIEKIKEVHVCKIVEELKLKGINCTINNKSKYEWFIDSLGTMEILKDCN
jgi:uncharacterized protein YjbK